MKIFCVFPSSTRERVSTLPARNMSRFPHSTFDSSWDERHRDKLWKWRDLLFFCHIFSSRRVPTARHTLVSMSLKVHQIFETLFLLLKRRRVHFQCRKRKNTKSYSWGSEETWSGGGRTSQWWILKLFINFIFTTRENLFRDNSNFSCRLENNRNRDEDDNFFFLSLVEFFFLFCMRKARY